LSDGGEFAAAHNIVAGRRRVARLMLGLARHGALHARIEPRRLNGLPALLLDFGSVAPPFAPRGVIRCDVGADGRIIAIHSVLASRKLTAVRWA